MLKRPFFLVFLTAAAIAPVSGLAHGAAAATSAAANDCKVTQSHSISGTVRTNIKFVNKTTKLVKIYWLDYSGKRVYYNQLRPGASYTQPTWKTHPWVVLDPSGKCVGYVVAPKAQYVITEPVITGGGAPAPRKETALSVTCNIGVMVDSECTVQVADATGHPGLKPPLGTVTFTATRGSVGKSCELKPTPNSPGVSSCTVSYKPPADLVTGEAVPVSAAYAGDATYAPSSGKVKSLK